ncbi:MAG TPA: hypothetical protein VF440_13425 [Novosphingobium sp.]
MMRSSSLKRGLLFSRTALGLALSLGVATGALVAQPALAAQKDAQQGKIAFSPGFAKAASELDKALTEGSKNPAVQAATAQARAAKDNPQAKAAAVAQIDAALGGAKAKIDALATLATTQGDKLKLGEMQRNYGVLTDDVPLQHRGLVGMLDSGVLPATSLGQVQWLAGVTAYQSADYANAAKYIDMAKASGFQDPQLDAVLGDAYKRSNNPAAALASAQRDIAAAKAAGSKPSEASIRTALQAAYDSKQGPIATELAVAWVKNYPSPTAWNRAVNVINGLNGYQPQDELDLLRLLARTNSYESAREYMRHIDAIDPRRLPGEAQKVIDAGVAAGKLQASDPTVVQARGIVNGRLASDRASLPAAERSARAASASAAMVTGTADAFLSYGEAAKAEELYTLALTKPGVDSARALTRLGIAQVDQGKGAEAQATFAKIQGVRQPIAQLWSAYAAQKGGAVTASAQ